MTDKKSKPATGTVVPTKSGRLQGIITLPNGKRKRLPAFPAGMSEAMAREKTAYWAERLRADSEETAQQEVRAAAGEAAEWWETFHSWREERGLYSVRNMYETHIEPVIATHPRDWTRADCERLRDSLDAKIKTGSWKNDARSYKFGWKRAWNVWTVFTTACKAAAFSKNKALRVRDSNPCSDVLPPDRGKAKAKQWLYPDEMLRLLSCETVPLHRRRLYALLAYTYLRPSELAALRWSDVELEVGLIQVSKTWNFEKGEAKEYTKSHAGVRPVPIEPALAPLLAKMGQGAPPSGPVVVDFPPTEGWAQTLRRDLVRAGVSRAALFDDTPTVKQITLYDLRATGITWRTLRRDDTRDIQKDAGHEKYATTEAYVRAASVYRDRIGAPFPVLPEKLISPGIVTRNRSPNANRAELTSFDGAHNLTPDPQSSGNHAGSSSGAVARSVVSSGANYANPGAVIGPIDHRAAAGAALNAYLRTLADELAAVVCAA